MGNPVYFIIINLNMFYSEALSNKHPYVLLVKRLLWPKWLLDE